MRFSLAHILEWATETSKRGALIDHVHDRAPVGQRSQAGPQPFSTVTMSSRADGWPPMLPGGLFVAVRGAVRDGHIFVADAFGNGAIAALVDHIPTHLENDVAAGTVRVIHLAHDQPDAQSLRGRVDGAPHRAYGHGGMGADRLASHPKTLVLVDPTVGTMAALQQLGGWWRRRWGRPVVAIAGSVGKTTTKDLVAAILSRQYRTLGTAGNLNNELGLPITLLGLHGDHDIAAVEIGISARGEMEAFAAIAAPDVAIVTRIEAEHLEFLRDIEIVAHEEGTIIAALTASGTAVLNADDPRVLAMAHRTTARVVTYGTVARDDLRTHTFSTDVRSLGVDGVEFRLWHDGHSELVQLPLAGRHFVSNALAAAAAGFAVGCSWTTVLSGLQDKPTAPRVRVIRPSPGMLVIDDSYNASPASCFAALDLLADSPGTRVAVLGDMLELGDFATEAHATVGAYVPSRADVLIAVGDASRVIADSATAGGMPSPHVFWVPRAADAFDAFETWQRATRAVGRFTVLVKGSRGMRMELASQNFAATDVSGHQTDDQSIETATSGNQFNDPVGDPPVRSLRAVPESGNQ